MIRTHHSNFGTEKQGCWMGCSNEAHSPKILADMTRRMAIVFVLCVVFLLCYRLIH